MWTPALAALAASVLTRRSLGAIGWRPWPIKWLAAGWIIPILYAFPAYALVWLATRVLARNRMSRHDGPLSVLRAYTPQEVRALCARAGLAGVRIHRYALLLRQCAVLVKP